MVVLKLRGLDKGEIFFWLFDTKSYEIQEKK